MWWMWIACAADVEDVLARVPDVEAGAEVFAEVCAECHADDGTGGEGSNLTNDDNTTEELAHKILHGWGDMEGFRGRLRAQDVADVCAYVAEVIQRP